MIERGSHVSTVRLQSIEAAREARREMWEMLKGKLKTKKATKGRTKVMADEEQQNGEPPEEEGPPPDQDTPADEAPPVAPAPPVVDRNHVLLLAAIMFTKPGPGTLREAYQHAKNLNQMLADDEAADENAP